MFSDWEGGNPSAAHTRIEPPVIARSGTLDITYEDLVPRRSVKLIGWELDQYALRVRYEVRPPIYAQPPPPEARWYLSGTDDLGNDYLSVGGAFGLSPDAECSKGVQSLQLPDPAASYVELVLEPRVQEAPLRIVRIELTDGDE